MICISLANIRMMMITIILMTIELDIVDLYTNMLTATFCQFIRCNEHKHQMNIIIIF